MNGLAMVVVTHNSAGSIEGLLNSIADAGSAALADVIVVDNGSTDDTRERVRAHPEVRLVSQANVGYAAGINAGVAAAPEAAVYLILNADLRLWAGCVPALLDAIGSPGVGIAAPLVLTPEGVRQDSLRREPSLLRALGLGWTGVALFSEYVSGDAAYRDPCDVDWALGAALAFSRGCYDDVGPWDDSYFLYSEETDYCRRARDAGWKVRFTPFATVVHVGGGSGRNDTTHVMQIVNKVRYYARHHATATAWLYWGLTLLSELSWVVRGHPQSRASVTALLRPSARPPVLGCSDSVLPR